MSQSQPARSRSAGTVGANENWTGTAMSTASVSARNQSGLSGRQITSHAKSSSLCPATLGSV
jgi:hypothetical protein